MTEEVSYSCRSCHHVFRLPASAAATCPACGGADVAAVSGWAPIGYNLTEGPPEWECRCQHCGRDFSVAVPASPAAASEITCPGCGGQHVHRLTPAGVEPLYCG